jgi:amino acid transporter
MVDPMALAVDQGLCKLLLLSSAKSAARSATARKGAHVADEETPNVIDLALLTEDEQTLAQLGYKQELHRSWSGFSNFAISFSIISILAGCFTTFGQGWNGGGPAAIAWGWPILAALILCIGLCLSELVSAFPTSGGIYWWASKLGGAKAGYYTGWLNLIGLLAIVASVAYGCATFLDLTFGFFSTSYHSGNLNTIFIYFVVILALVSLANIFSSHLLAVINNVSVWWHVFGAGIIVLILILLPHHHASASMVFTSTVNNTGFFGGKTHGLGFLIVVMPIGALLTQYTITGYDASAHLSEETMGAASSAAKGIWRSIFYSAIGGWILLLAFLFAVQDESKVTAGGGGVSVIFAQALTSRWGGTVLLISAIGQFFCTTACLTSCTRMLFAFSRDGAVPGHKMWSRLSSKRVPVAGVILTAVIAVIITLPALVKVNIAGAPVPVAFYAVVSIGVIGLYWCFAIPIWKRLKMGDSFEPGEWNLGKRYKVLAIIALADVVLVTFMAFMPTSNLGVPWNSGFAWKYVNYTILVVPAAMIFLWIYWHLSVKKWFTGPKHTIVLLGPDMPAGSLP